MGNPIDGDKGVKYGKANGASRNGNEENIETAPVILSRNVGRGFFYFTFRFGG